MTLPSSLLPSVGDEGVEGTGYAPGLFPLLSRYLVIRSTSSHLVIHPARVVLVVGGAMVSHAPPRLSSSLLLLLPLLWWWCCGDRQGMVVVVVVREAVGELSHM
jgi:hypothetical protein